MKRRFLQFSLRGLLGFAAIICLLLGARHLLETYGNRLDVEDAKVGDFIRVKARYFRVFGPSECVLEAGYKAADGSMLPTRNYGMSSIQSVEREWLCLYRSEWELYPVNGPCQLMLELKRYDAPDFDPDGKEWTIQEKIVDLK